MHAEELALSAVNAEAFHLNSVVFSETKSAATESDVISDSDRDDVCISWQWQWGEEQVDLFNLTSIFFDIEGVWD